jgi:type III restriction enzyme
VPSQFAVLVPKVREFLEKKAFGQVVDLKSAAMVKAISSNVASYVTVSTFVKALRSVVVEELKPQLLNTGRKLSETVPFPWSRPTFTAGKCIFNLVPCDNEFEKEFATFLEKSTDVERFAKLPQRFGFVIEYTDAVGNLRYYEPDFVAVLSDSRRCIVETKGQEDVNVANKDRAAAIWCENASALTSQSWAYLKVKQSEYMKLQPDTFADLSFFWQRV